MIKINYSCFLLGPQNSNAQTQKVEPSPPPDSNKKFFKTSRAKATITITKNMKLEFTHGKMTLLERKQIENKPQKVQLDDATDLNITEFEEQTEKDAIMHALRLLDEDKENVGSEANKKNTICENRTPKADEIFLSPISQMCDTTSGLALCSPKGARNLTPVLDDIQSSSK